MNMEKLKDIKARIKDLKTPKVSNSKIRQEINAFSIATDLVSGTMVGVMIGIFTDKFFHSKPLFLIIFTIIGMIAGFNIVRQKVKDRLFSKLAYREEFQGDTKRSAAVYKSVREDASIRSTSKLPLEVEFGEKSSKK